MSWLARLGAQDVGRVGPQPVGPQGVGHRRFVDQARPGGVDQHQVRLGQAQPGRVDQHRVTGRVQGDDVTAPGELVEVHPLDAQPVQFLLRHPGVVAQHGAAEAAQPGRDLTTDPAEPDDADGELSELAGPAHRPPAGPHPPVPGGHVAQRGQDERHRMVGDGAAVGSRGVRHQDAALGGGRQVDGLHPDAVARHDLQLRGGVQVVGGHRTGARHPGRGRRQQGPKGLEIMVRRPGDDLATRLGQLPGQIEIPRGEGAAGDQHDGG